MNGQREKDRERLLELVLLALVAVAVVALGAPEVVQSLRDGAIDLGTLFYPVLLAAFLGLAWSRRSGV